MHVSSAPQLGQNCESPEVLRQENASAVPYSPDEDWAFMGVGEGITVSLRFFLQMALLLASSQIILGLVGYGLALRFPWVGLLATLLLLWLIVRTASVLRYEIDRARRNRKPVVPAATALVVAFLWQLPGLLVLPLWAPRWAWAVWQGAVLPLPAVVGRLAGTAQSAEPWVWGAYVVEILLFVGLASRSLQVRSVRRRGGVQGPSAGNTENVAWAPARRYSGPDRSNRNEAPEEKAETGTDSEA